MIGNLTSSLIKLFPRITPIKEVTSSLVAPTPNFCNYISIRTKMRYYFPRPKETKRVRHQGWLARLSTASGRKVLMRRILRGKHVLSH